jgi:Phasin protein
MSKPPSKRPPSSRPSARRSLVELTAAASRAAEEGPPVAPLAPAATAIDPMPRRAPVAPTPRAETATAREVAEAPVVLPGAAVQTGRVASLERPVTNSVGAAARYRAESLELMRASLETAIDHARELIRARTLSECVALSSGLARKQREFAKKQAGAWKSFARAAVQSDPW